MIYLAVFVGGALLSYVLGMFTWTDEEALPRPDRRNFGPAISLVQAARGFFAHSVAWLLCIGAITAWCARVAFGSWSVWDFVACASVVALYPLFEWAFHWLEHNAPFRLCGREFTFVASRTHKAHHRNPWDPRFGMTTLHNLPVLLGSFPALLLMLAPVGPALTASAAFGSAYLSYEWIHYLTHTSYRPVTRFYRNLYQNHRRHHFRDEKLWLGVSALYPDRLMRTWKE